MAGDIIYNYISQRYDRWLDYSLYHCSHQGMTDEAIDVLNEVLAMLLEKYKDNEAYIVQLYERKKGQYRELDFFVLQMIKLNIQSPTSPYRHRYKTPPIDENADLSYMDILDENDDEPDRVGEILDKVHQVREIVDNLMLSDKAKAIFYHRFFDGESFAEWDGEEDVKYLYDTYNGVLELIKDKLNKRELF